MNDTDRAQMALNHLLTAIDYLVDVGMDVTAHALRLEAEKIKNFLKMVDKRSGS